jgi:hypothetical protein
MTETNGPHGEETESWVNQRRHEPMPASHHDERDQEAVARNQEHAAARAQDPGQDPSGDAGDDGPGKAIRDMMPGGPAPQGDVPDAPAVQIATAEDRGDQDDPDRQPGPPRLMSNAVPGKPDGEVDTRP